MFPKASVIRFDFAAYRDMPELKVFWYEGMKENPKIAGLPEGEWLGDPPAAGRPEQAEVRGPGGTAPAAPRENGAFGINRRASTDFRSPGRVFDREELEALQSSTTPLRFPQPNGSLFVGGKGMLTTGTYGEVARLLPVERMRDYRMPAPLLTRSPGHMRDFIRACKGGNPACSNFDVAAPFVEWMLLGVIALRHEGKLEYDADKMRITNNVEANKLLKPTLRKGWEFHTVKA
jgi:hypothetical protein